MGVEVGGSFGTQTLRSWVACEAQQQGEGTGRGSGGAYRGGCSSLLGLGGSLCLLGLDHLGLFGLHHLLLGGLGRLLGGRAQLVVVFDLQGRAASQVSNGQKVFLR